MATKTKKQENKKEFTLQQAFALWKRKSKNGKPYFTGKDADGHKLRGFFNTNKKKPTEPDLQVYRVGDGEIIKGTRMSFWCNVSKTTKKKYLSGKIGDQRVVGFIYEGDNENAPYVSFYYSDDEQKPKEIKQEEIDLDEVSEYDDLPF